MPSFVVHGVIPLLFLLAIRPLSARRVWMLWPLTFLPDLDYFFGFHRATFTNLFVLLPIVAFGAYAWRRKRVDWMQFALIAFVYLGSHLVMDALTGGIVPFYPFSTQTFCYYGEIDVVTATNTMRPDFEACSHAGVPQVAELYPWLGQVDTAVLAFLVPASLAVAGWQWWRGRTAASDAA